MQPAVTWALYTKSSLFSNPTARKMKKAATHYLIIKNDPQIGAMSILQKALILKQVN